MINHSKTITKLFEELGCPLKDRANGRCKYFGEQGLLMAIGNQYIQAHHILGLGANGPDTVANVIGLCPGHHREAHFGEKAQSLNESFKTIVDGL